MLFTHKSRSFFTAITIILLVFQVNAEGDEKRSLNEY